MNYVNLATREVVTATTLKYTGLRLSDLAVVRQAGWAPVEEDKPEYDPEIQKLEKGELVITGATAIQHYVVVPLTEEELAARAQSKKQREEQQAREELKNLDAASIRSVRAVLSAIAASEAPAAEDLQVLAQIEAQAQTVRETLGTVE